MKRRRFLRTVTVGTTALLASEVPLTGGNTEGRGTAKESAPTSSRYEAWLRARHAQVLTRRGVEAFLRHEPPPNNQWARFDPDLGYVPKDSIQRDGIDGSFSVYRHGSSGERKTINYASHPCRINTYGDSFTQCHQVSDGETWQESLAAHLGEPIRNFGVGGYGVFQAFARLRRTEDSACKARYLILNIFDDDHQRSVMPWRSYLVNWRGSDEMFHSAPWTHLRVNLDSGLWEEVPAACRTPDALRHLLDFQRARAVLADDVVVQLRAMAEGVPDVPRESVRRLADWAKLKFGFTDTAARRKSASELVTDMARKSTYCVLEKLREYCTNRGRKLMVLLSYGSGAVARACSGAPKDHHDVALAAWLKECGVPCVDAIDAHRADFQQFRLTPAEYVNRYYHGHYRPQGNQFFAFAIKNAVVEWLDPKPIAYQQGGAVIDFQDGHYLEKAPAIHASSRSSK